MKMNIIVEGEQREKREALEREARYDAARVKEFYETDPGALTGVPYDVTFASVDIPTGARTPPKLDLNFNPIPELAGPSITMESLGEMARFIDPRTNEIRPQMTEWMSKMSKETVAQSVWDKLTNKAVTPTPEFRTADLLDMSVATPAMKGVARKPSINNP